jgi:hypothetical protein
MVVQAMGDARRNIKKTVDRKKAKHSGGKGSMERIWDFVRPLL